MLGKKNKIGVDNSDVSFIEKDRTGLIVTIILILVMSIILFYYNSKDNTKLKTLQHQGHSYIIFNKSKIYEGYGGITHDPDCNKCNKVKHE